MGKKKTFYNLLYISSSLQSKNQHGTWDPPGGFCLGYLGKEMLRVWPCNFFYSVICGTAVKAPPSGSLPVVNSVSRVARSDSGCSISPSTSHHIPQTCDSGVVRNRQGLSCRSASGSSGLAASSGCQLPRRHSLPVVFAQRSVLSNLLSNRGVHSCQWRMLPRSKRLGQAFRNWYGSGIISAQRARASRKTSVRINIPRRR